MEIVERTEEGVRCVALSGRLDSNTSRELEQKLLPMVDEEGSRLLVDLTDLNYISSAGLRVFLLAAKRSKKQQSKIVLAALSENVREVFDISGFSTLFTIATSPREGATACKE